MTCVVLVFVLFVPACSVCDVDCSVGYCCDYEAVLFGCVAVGCPEEFVGECDEPSVPFLLSYCE